jgi:hypothetical protein
MMLSTKVTSTANAERYGWGDGCDAWYLVKNDRLHIIQESMPPGTSETRHLHHGCSNSSMCCAVRRRSM